MDIHDWWNRTRRGDGALKLSSRRLALFVGQLSEESNFWSSASEDWSFNRKLMVAQINELRLRRSEAVVQAGGDWQEPILIKTPGQELADELDAEQKKAIRVGIMSQLHQGV